MARIDRTRESRADVVEIVLRVRRENPKAAKRLLDAINKTIKLLAAFPAIGPRRDELADALRSFPVSKYTDYLVFYRPITDGIEVIRVLHGSRNLRRLFRR